MSKPEIKISFQRNLQRLILESLDKLDLNQSRLMSKKARYVFGMLTKTKKAEKSIIRLILTRLFPWDPLTGEQQSEICIYLLTHEKDLEILPYSLYAAVRAVKGNLKSVTVVAPEYLKTTVEQIISTIHPKTIYISDEVILNKYLPRSWKKLSNLPKMEIIKICCGMFSESKVSLILDGDTVLLRSRIWSSNRKRIAIVAQEYLLRHIKFNQEIMSLDSGMGLGFVSHHQVIDREILKLFIEEKGGIEKVADLFGDSYLTYSESNNPFPSEWQLIGDINISRNRENTELAKFSNYGISRESMKFEFEKFAKKQEVADAIQSIRRDCPRLGSVSFHGYK